MSPPVPSGTFAIGSGSPRWRAAAPYPLRRPVSKPAQTAAPPVTAAAPSSSAPPGAHTRSTLSPSNGADADLAGPAPAQGMDLDASSAPAARDSAPKQPDASTSSALTREQALQRLRPAPKAHSLRTSASATDFVLVFARVGRQDLRTLKRLLSKVKFPVSLVLNFRWVSVACVELTLHQADAPSAEAALRELGFAILRLDPTVPLNTRATLEERQAFRSEFIQRITFERDRFRQEGWESLAAFFQLRLDRLAPLA
ncbi:hypothetical protein V8E36_008964 [Tilletia maclaganii]